MSEVIDVKYEVSVDLEERSTDRLMHEANGLYQQMEAVGNIALMLAAGIGRRLLVVKKRIPHGDFGEWCAENLDFSQSKANKLMQFAERTADENSVLANSETFTNLSISKAFALLSAPEEVAEEVLRNENLEEMTVRELRAEIDALKAEAEEADHLRQRLEEVIAEKKALEETALNSGEDQSAAVEEAQKKIDALEKKLTKAQEKEKKAKADAAAEAEKAVRKAKDEAAKEVEAAKASGKAEAAEELEEAGKKIERLEKELAASSSEELSTFRAQADLLQEVCDKCRATIAAADPELAPKLQGALEKILEIKLQQIKGD